MGWVSPKVYAILSKSEEGKDILEGIGDKDQGQVDREVDAFFAGKGQKGPEEGENDVLKSTTAEEKEYIKGKTKAIWQGSKAGPRIEFLHEELNEAIDKLPDVYSDMIITAMREELQGGIWQGKGQGYFDPYERKIVVDRRQLLEDGRYERNSVFFHEVGHAVDRNLAGGHGYASDIFVSEKYGTTLTDMIRQEAGAITDEDFEEIVKNGRAMSSDDFESEKKRLYDDYREKIYEENKLQESFSTEFVNECNGRFGEGVAGISPGQYSGWLFKDKMRDELGVSTYSDFFRLPSDEQKSFRQRFEPEISKKVSEYKKFLDDYKKKDPKIAPFWEKYQQKVEERKEKYLQYERLLKRDDRVWGNCADLVGGAKGKWGADGIIFGHEPKYWSNGNKIGHEAFAEFFEGMTNHKEAYFNMKSIFPKSAEIFEEIVKNGKLH